MFINIPIDLLISESSRILASREYIKYVQHRTNIRTFLTPCRNTQIPLHAPFVSFLSWYKTGGIPSSYITPLGDSLQSLPREIESKIQAVVLDVETRLQNAEKAVPIGVLSADDRNCWSKVNKHYPYL